MDVGDFMLVKILWCWQQNFDIGDIFWMFVPDAYVDRYRMLVTKSTKTVTNITKLSPTLQSSSPTAVTNIDVAFCFGFGRSATLNLAGQKLGKVSRAYL